LRFEIQAFYIKRVHAPLHKGAERKPNRQFGQNGARRHGLFSAQAKSRSVTPPKPVSASDTSTFQKPSPRKASFTFSSKKALEGKKTKAAAKQIAARKAHKRNL
jgi:hypothetical protein